MSIPVSATATGTTKVTFFADFTGASCTSAPTTVASQLVVGAGPTYSTTLDVTVPGPGCYTIRADAVDACIIFLPAVISVHATPVTGVFVNTPPGCSLPVKETAVDWSSDLSLEGRLQMVLDGTVSVAGRGRTFGRLPNHSEETRVEATVVEAAGKPGLWRFDLAGGDAAATRIRVVTGDVVSVTGSSVTFRLQGKAGERVAFTITRP
jgi:hypothetical protein